MKVICLAGLTGSGKSVVADCVKKWCKKHAHNFLLLSFAKSLVGADISRKTRHDVAQNDIGETIKDIATNEKEMYLKLCKAGKENLFVETVIIIDDVHYLDDLKFLMNFNSMNVFVDAGQRLDPAKFTTSQDHLAKSVHTGKYPVDIFHTIIDNNTTKRNLTKLMDHVTPNLIYR